MTRSYAFSRKDANHDELTAIYVSMGCSCEDTSALGNGFPDAVVGTAGVTDLVEFKTEKGTLEPRTGDFRRAMAWCSRAHSARPGRRHLSRERHAAACAQAGWRVIHYHGLPMWPATAMIGAMRTRHAMVSFEEPRQIEDAAEICQSIVLDNGAFSAWKAGRALDFAGYRAWACEWLKHPSVDWCVVPDVIDGDEAANDALLWDWDLPSWQSVPVYHMHESLDRLDRLCTWPRVAIGSSGQYATPGTGDWWARMSEIMRVACDSEGRPRCKLHGLRMLDPVIFSHVPLASADSCNVARNLGIDSRWVGPYAPRNKTTRALIMMDRIESHASARRWARESAGVQQNLELIG